MITRILSLVLPQFITDPRACGARRSPKWPALQRRWLAAHPACAVCGCRNGVVPHHVVPVHVDPAMELDDGNLITLCPPHHILVGHLMNFRSWNPEVCADAATWQLKIVGRP